MAIATTDQSGDPTITEMIRTASIQNGIDPDLAIGIANCESHGRQFDKDGHIVRGAVNPQDIGLFQINEEYHLKQSQKLGMDIYTLQGNIDYAMHLIKTQGSKPWFWSKTCWVKEA